MNLDVLDKYGGRLVEAVEHVGGYESRMRLDDGQVI